MKSIRDMNPEEQKNLLDHLTVISNCGGILKDRREQLGVTQEQAAKLAEIPLRRYQRYESNETKLSSASFSVGCRVCKALSLDPLEVLGLKHTP